MSITVDFTGLIVFIGVVFGIFVLSGAISLLVVGLVEHGDPLYIFIELWRTRT